MLIEGSKTLVSYLFYHFWLVFPGLYSIASEAELTCLLYNAKLYFISKL